MSSVIPDIPKTYGALLLGALFASLYVTFQYGAHSSADIQTACLVRRLFKQSSISSYIPKIVPLRRDWYVEKL